MFDAWMPPVLWLQGPLAGIEGGMVPSPAGHDRDIGRRLAEKYKD
jgi:hypothetical protein